ncbi:MULTISPECIES: hypothetical protein [Wolbachia]|uniref:Uncharacterized protein n=1 Tax=Wolbachia pipientis TaxID=955 RepID=A0A7G5CBW4_WOLPI|nr:MULTISPECIES: hypothetical protein [Wolbachia]MDE5060816.1 hypothetical protein [Wolbachia endosymbiont of Drosophila nikananu]QMV46698.1 hypothetical protein HC356_00800 [Wolbachia pipientis]
MNSFIPEEKENPIVTLKAQAEKFGFSRLRADKNNESANTGEQMYKDFQRMDFVINGKSISGDLTAKLCKEYNSLLPKSEDENYRPFAKEVFKEMFKYAEAKVPSDSILEELVTNCNQAGYEAGVFIESQLALGQHSFLVLSPKRVMNIDYIDQNNVSIRSDMKLPIFFQRSDGKAGDKVCDLSSSIEFTLESQDGKEGVIYKDGKLSLTVPKRLKDYNIGDKNLFDVIKECFQKFCERLGFFKIKIEHGLDKPPKVNSHLENMEPPIHSNEHGNTPGN